MEERMGHTTDLKSLQESLGYLFHDLSFLETALTHKSYKNENQCKEVLDNERFEFLGDAVLGLAVSDFLIHKLVDGSEGALSKIKGFVVSEGFLHGIARKLDLGEYLRLGRGESNSGGRQKRSILADSFEALVAAVYLDGGYHAAYDFIIRQIGDKINTLTDNAVIPDYKSLLQEYTQGELGCIPAYRVISETGMDHNPEFEVCIFIQDKACGQGKGRSKKDAEQEAAFNALLQMNVEGI